MTKNQSYHMKQLLSLRHALQRKFCITKKQAAYLIRVVAIHCFGRNTYKSKILDNVAFIEHRLRLHQARIFKLIHNKQLCWDFSDRDLGLIHSQNISIVRACMFISPQKQMKTKNTK